MNFQHILELAAKNQKVAEKKLGGTKRYSTKVPPPKKESRPAVDPSAIQAKIEQKEREKQQRVKEEERQKKEGIKRQLEAEKRTEEEKRTNRRAARKSKSRLPVNKDTGREEGTTQYNDDDHKVVHKAFMQKVEREAEKSRTKEAKKEVRDRPLPKPKSKKKAAPIPKKPMSYDELLKFAEQQKKGLVPKNELQQDEDEENEESEDEGEGRGRERESRQSREANIKERYKDLVGGTKRNGMHSADRLQTSISERNRNRLIPKMESKRSHHSKDFERKKVDVRNMEATGIRKDIKTNLTFKEKGEKGGVNVQAKKVNNGMVAGGSSKHRGADLSSVAKPIEKTDHKQPARTENQPGRHKPGGVPGQKLVPRPDEKLSARPRPQSRPQERPSSRSGHPTRPNERQEPRPKAHPVPRPQGHDRERPRPQGHDRERPRPQGHDRERPRSQGHDRERPRPQGHGRERPRPQGNDRERPRPPGLDRERPRPSGMGPLSSSQFDRKRPAKPPIMNVKRGRVVCSDSEESDYDDGDGFIDDTPMEEMECSNVSSYIKEIFGYDKSKYGCESDYALRSMDASYKDIQREEARSARLGMLEDLEDMKQEKEEMKRKALKKGKKR